MASKGATFFLFACRQPSCAVLSFIVQNVDLLYIVCSLFFLVEDHDSDKVFIFCTNRCSIFFVLVFLRTFGFTKLSHLTHTRVHRSRCAVRSRHQIPSFCVRPRRVLGAVDQTKINSPSLKRKERHKKTLPNSEGNKIRTPTSTRHKLPTKPIFTEGKYVGGRSDVSSHDAVGCRVM